MKEPFSKLILITLSLLYFSCDQPTESTVGSTHDTTIQGLTFTVDTTYLDGSAVRLVAKGTVRYNGNSQVSSPWYVEAQFYTNKSLTTKLGGNYTQIGVPLNKNQSTLWTIYYASSNVDVRNYPDFGISDIRGIYK